MNTPQYSIMCLPFDGGSQIALDTETNKLFFAKDYFVTHFSSNDRFKTHQIYLVSDETPKQGDFFVVRLYGKATFDKFCIEKCETISDVWVNGLHVDSTRHKDNCKKNYRNNER